MSVASGGQPDALSTVGNAVDESEDVRVLCLPPANGKCRWIAGKVRTDGPRFSCYSVIYSTYGAIELNAHDGEAGA